MFMKLHLFSQASPDGSEDFSFRATPYFRMVENLPRGPSEFQWSERQRKDLQTLWLEPDSEGARDRLAKDLASFAERLGWTLDADELEDAEDHGEEVLLTLNSAARELYFLPWEVIRVGSSDSYLADYSTALVRYAVPGREARPILGAPPDPGVLFAWSDGGGSVPSEEQGASIRQACEDAGAVFKEIARVGEAELQDALEDDPPSVLHLLCHGVPGPEGEPPRLAWSKGKRSAEVSATRLARMLRRYRKSIRLVVLSACGSGDGRQDVLFMSSLAQEIHKEGIPNVVASRYPLSIRGSRVLVKALYDKLLREAWSLERSLQHTRQQLLKADDDGNSHSGDAYGIQLYAHDTETFESENGIEARRQVLASYPFGTAEQPTPKSLPPRKEARLEAEVAHEVTGKATEGATEDSTEEATEEATEATEQILERLLDDSGASDSALIGQLQQAAEDTSLKLQVEKGSKGVVLTIDTTVDGAQRVLQAWRTGELSEDTGLKIFNVKVSKAIKPPLLLAAIRLLAGGGKAASASAGAAAVATATVSKIASVKVLAAVLAGIATITIGSVLLTDDEPPGDAPAEVATVADAGAARSSASPVTPRDAMPEPAADAAPEIPDAAPDAALRPPDAAVVAVVTPDAAVATKPAVKPTGSTTKPSTGTATTPPTATTSPATVAAPAVSQQGQYDPIGQRVRVSWTLPAGVAGVLVVKSNAGVVRGRPRAGTSYGVGSTWAGGPGAVVGVSSKKTSHIWSLPAGQTIWLALWAFDADKNYSAVEQFKFVAPAAPAIE